MLQVLLNLEGHGFYIYASYILAAIILVWAIFSGRRQHKRSLKELRAAKDFAEARKAANES